MPVPRPAPLASLNCFKLRNGAAGNLSCWRAMSVCDIIVLARAAGNNGPLELSHRRAATMATGVGLAMRCVATVGIARDGSARFRLASRWPHDAAAIAKLNESIHQQLAARRSPPVQPARSIRRRENRSNWSLPADRCRDKLAGLGDASTGLPGAPIFSHHAGRPTVTRQLDRSLESR